MTQNWLIHVIRKPARKEDATIILLRIFLYFRIQENVYLPADRSGLLPPLLSNHRPRENRQGKYRCLTGVTLSKRQIH